MQPQKNDTTTMIYFLKIIPRPQWPRKRTNLLELLEVLLPAQ